MNDVYVNIEACGYESLFKDKTKTLYSVEEILKRLDEVYSEKEELKEELENLEEEFKNEKERIRENIKQ